MQADFFSILGSLIRNYVENAPVFLLLHAGLVFLVWRSLREVAQETRSLKAWTPEDPRPRGICAGLLTQFVLEARSSGVKGVITPMTDFSDRIDKHVTGLEESLHNRINLFVVIGIAGTFFGLFSFVRDARSAGAQIAELLRSSLAYAFPVGFAGLLLMIVAYFFAQSAIDNLNEAASKATQRALSLRAQWMVGPAHIIEGALNRELAPLRNLDETLGERLQPIMEQFRNQLAESSKVLGTQVAPLGEAVRSLQLSTAVLSASMTALATAADRLPESYAQMTELQQKTMEMLRRLEGSMATFEQQFAAMSRAPQEMLAVYAREMQELTPRLEAEWKRGVGQMLAGLETHHLEALGNLREQAARSAEAMNAAGADMREAAQNVELLLNRAMQTVAREAVQRIEPELRQLSEGLSVHVPALRSGLESAAADAAGVERNLRGIVEMLEQSRARWTPIADKLERAAGNLQAPALTPIQNTLDQMAASMDRISERIDQPFWTSWFGRRRKDGDK